MMRVTKWFAAALLPWVCSLGLAAPAALVEDVSIDSAGVQMLDFVSPGQVIDLGVEGKLTLGYLSSCVQEQISGGKVTVGQSQSQVVGGEVSRNKTQCDGGGLSLSAEQAMHSGAVAMRAIGSVTASSLLIHHVSPLLLLSKAGRVTIKRIDKTGERHKFTVSKAQSPGRVHLDLAAEQVRLIPGGQYMITASGVAKIIDVAPDASEAGNAMLGRVVPL
jgi:hypothetical protein